MSSPHSSPETPVSTLTAFAGFRCIASGPRDDVLARLRELRDAGGAPAFVFDDRTGDRLDIDWRPAATPAEPPAAAASHAQSSQNSQPGRTVGRPRLGVVAREVTLLPRHWDWLSRQPGGASVALRRLVDEARHVHADRDARRAAREAAYRFMSAIAGDLPGFEEAARALFADDRMRFEERIAAWPADLGTHLRKLAAASWSGE